VAISLSLADRESLLSVAMVGFGDGVSGNSPGTDSVLIGSLEGDGAWMLLLRLAKLVL
jgi:hypothetical protein